MRRTSRTVLLAGVLLGFVFGCGETVDPPYLVVKERFIGLTAEVVGDETRATPRPGETIAFRWTIIDVDGDAPSTWAFQACEPAVTSGIPFCREDGAFMSADLELDPANGERAMEVTIPEDFAGGEILVLGAACMGGVLDVTGLDFRDLPTPEEMCRGDEGLGQIAFFTHPIEQSEMRSSRSPVWEAIRVGGVGWAESEITEGCQPGLPSVVMGDDEVEIEMELAEGSREMFTYIDDETGMAVMETESIRITVLVTGGQLQRMFSRSDEENPIPVVEWRPPREGDEPAFTGGDTVRFWFTARDLRGGYATTSRVICVE